MLDRKIAVSWIKEGIKDGAIHVFLVRDITCGEIYPVFVGPKESVKHIFGRFHHKNNGIVIFSLSLANPINFNKLDLPPMLA